MGVTLRYKIVFPFDDDARANGLSFEIRKLYDSEARLQRALFYTLGEDRAMEVLDLEKAYLKTDEKVSDSELESKMNAITICDGDYDVHFRFEVNGKEEKHQERASVLLKLHACCGDTSSIKSLLRRSPDPTALLLFRTTDGSTLFHLAVPNGQIDTVRYLLGEQSPVNIPDNKGRTPLMEAALWGHCEIVQLLLEAGASPQLEDKSGLTALKLAQESRANDQERRDRSLKYSEDPVAKKRARRTIRELLANGSPGAAQPKANLNPLHLYDAHFHKSAACGTISFVAPSLGIEIRRQTKTAAILVRSASTLPVAAVSGWSGSPEGEFRGTEGGFEMLNEAYWSLHENLAVARDIGFIFGDSDIDMPGLKGSYNACHAEAQLMCFAVRRNYLFPPADQEQDPIPDGFYRLLTLQRQYTPAITILVSKEPCRSCSALQEGIYDKTGIVFDLRALPVR